VATATGIVLLLGGAGSLAYWTDSATPSANNQQINAGTLALTAGTGTWTKAFVNAAGTTTVGPAPVTDFTNVKIVPGNKLVFTQVYTVTAAGDDLFFRIGGNTAASGTLSPGTLATAIGGANSVYSVTTSALTGIALTGVTANTYKVTGTGTGTITVTWTITWPFGIAGGTGGTADNNAKGATVTLTAAPLTLTQVDAA
jgi:alternate signal-mediated exported protein